jgi:hypothetical protein
MQKEIVMTEPKHVALSLKNILEHPVVKAVLNRSCNIMPATVEALSWWSYDLIKRKPSPAYNEYGVFTGTDLDLACFLYALVGRGAVINIPYYESHTRSKIREDQVVKSRANRHGTLVGIGANKYFFSFNIKIIDQNVIGEDKVGDFRRFSLTDKYGAWYDGWREIQFEPTLKENRFITENKLWTGNKIIFKNFIHPNRWTSFFGHYYVITKMLTERLEEEARHLNTEITRMLATGIKFPEGEGPTSYPTDYGPSKQESFPAFECKIYIPSTQTEGAYPTYEDGQENLIRCYNLRKDYYKIIEKLRFMTRATEYAHYEKPALMPAWLKNVNWESGFREPKKRTDWQRLKLFQPKVGEYSISILKRSYAKSTTVADN